MTFKEVMADVADGFELFGAVVLILGFAVGFARAGLSLARRAPGAQVYPTLRSFVGRTILLGLEVLVAADLLRTVAVTPTWESVGVLAVIVLIRTFLSFAIDIEIDGRPPWSRGREDASAGGDDRDGSAGPTTGNADRVS
jgi:uncharacterized membrane protein